MARTLPLLTSALLACMAGAPVAAQLPQAGSSSKAAAVQPGPETPRVPTRQTLHGVELKDDYRWLEDGRDPKVQAWSEAQNTRARAYLDALPGVEILRKRITDLRTKRPTSFGGLVHRPGGYFTLRYDPAKQQPDLVVLDSYLPGTKPRLLLDLMALDPTGGTAIDWFVPSQDGTRIAVSLSQGGSEEGTLHVYDTATGKETGDLIPRVQVGTGGGSLAWAKDGQGFWYTRYPRTGDRPAADLDFYQQIYFHKLGTPEKTDAYEVGKAFPRIAEAQLQASEDGKHVLALVGNGDGGDHALWLRGSKGWTLVAKDEDGVISAQFGRDGALWLLSKKDAPRRKVLRLSLRTPKLNQAKVVIPSQRGVLEAITATEHCVYAVEMLGGPSRIRQFDLQGKERSSQVPTGPVTTNYLGARLDGDDVMVYTTGFKTPSQELVYRAATGKLEPTVVRTTPLVDFSDAEVIQEEATSKDGTRIPMFIFQKIGTKRDGSNPTLLTGYGGFGISTQPSYSDMAHVLLEQGVVRVQTALRGGGEFGEAWHQGGSLLNKQHVFDDFIACAQRLVELGYTTPARLAIEGGSNGGLLMGAALTQRPDLFRTVISHVGIYDMIHVEDSANGQFNITEFGTVKDPTQFKALLAYSPYHRVQDGAAYPSILFLTGANDPRVDTMQSRKMTARLQAANPKGRPVFLRTSANTGHGMGSPLAAQIEQAVDVDAFLLHELGVTVKAVE
jgi:prolyl oligopeptidase